MGHLNKHDCRINESPGDQANLLTTTALPPILPKQTRRNIGWILSYIYLSYLLIGQTPLLKDTPFFSTIIVSVMFIGVYAVSSVLIIGTRNSVVFFLIAATVGSLMELLSLNTGFPFGKYFYTAELGPMVGQLPVFIPLLWASLGFYAYRAGGKYGMPFLMVFIDLALDPRLSGHLWIWISETQYFGDPITNFVGWFVTSALIILIYSLVEKNGYKVDVLAIVFYLIYGLSECISDVYAHLDLPALISACIFITSSIILIYLNYKHKHRFSNDGTAVSMSS